MALYFWVYHVRKIVFPRHWMWLWPWLLQSFLDFGRSCLQCSFRSPPRSCSVELHSRQSLCHLWNNLKLSMNGRRTVLRVPCEIEKKPIWGQQSCENWTALQVPFLAGFRTQIMSPQNATMFAKEFFLDQTPGWLLQGLPFVRHEPMITFWSLFDHFWSLFDHFLCPFQRVLRILPLWISKNLSYGSQVSRCFGDARWPNMGFSRSSQCFL